MSKIGPRSGPLRNSATGLVARSCVTLAFPAPFSGPVVEVPAWANGDKAEVCWWDGVRGWFVHDNHCDRPVCGANRPMSVGLAETCRDGLSGRGVAERSRHGHGFERTEYCRIPCECGQAALDLA